MSPTLTKPFRIARRALRRALHPRPAPQLDPVDAWLAAPRSITFAFGPRAALDLIATSRLKEMNAEEGAALKRGCWEWKRRCMDAEEGRKVVQARKARKARDWPW